MDVLVWTATNLISALILPPGVFFVLLAMGLYWSRKHRWGRWLAAGSLVSAQGVWSWSLAKGKGNRNGSIAKRCPARGRIALV